MRHYRTQLKRCQRLLDERQDTRRGRTPITQLEVYSDGDLVEVMPLPYRVYELDDAGRRVFIEPDEDERALDEWARRLVHGR